MLKGRLQFAGKDHANPDYSGGACHIALSRDVRCLPAMQHKRRSQSYFFNTRGRSTGPGVAPPCSDAWRPQTPAAAARTTSTSPHAQNSAADEAFKVSSISSLPSCLLFCEEESSELLDKNQHDGSILNNW